MVISNAQSIPKSFTLLFDLGELINNYKKGHLVFFPKYSLADSLRVNLTEVQKKITCRTIVSAVVPL